MSYFAIYGLYRMSSPYPLETRAFPMTACEPSPPVSTAAPRNGSFCPITTSMGQGLHYFSSCPRLSNLAIWQCPPDQRRRRRYRHLQTFSKSPLCRSIRGTSLGDAGLPSTSAALINLTRLQLVGDRFTDEGARHLTNLKSLTWLSLDSVNGKLTDTRPFEALSDLKYLDTGSAGLPMVEAERLIKALPDLSLHPAPIP